MKQTPTRSDCRPFHELLHLQVTGVFLVRSELLQFQGHLHLPKAWIRVATIWESLQLRPKFVDPFFMFAQLAEDSEGWSDSNFVKVFAIFSIFFLNQASLFIFTASECWIHHGPVYSRCPSSLCTVRSCKWRRLQRNHHKKPTAKAQRHKGSRFDLCLILWSWSTGGRTSIAASLMLVLEMQTRPKRAFGSCKMHFGQINVALGYCLVPCLFFLSYNVSNGSKIPIPHWQLHGLPEIWSKISSRTRILCGHEILCIAATQISEFWSTKPVFQLPSQVTCIGCFC